MTNLITKQPAYVSLKVVDHVAIFYKLLNIRNQWWCDRTSPIEMDRTLNLVMNSSLLLQKSAALHWLHTELLSILVTSVYGHPSFKSKYDTGFVCSECIAALHAATALTKCRASDSWKCETAKVLNWLTMCNVWQWRCMSLLIMRVIVWEYTVYCSFWLGCHCKCQHCGTLLNIISPELLMLHTQPCFSGVAYGVELFSLSPVCVETTRDFVLNSPHGTKCWLSDLQTGEWINCILPMTVSNVTLTVSETMLCDKHVISIADCDVRLCRLMSQLADVNIPSSVGMFTV